jgi:hypothetical protein
MKMKFLLAALLAFTANAHADENSDEASAPDPILSTCKITAEDIGKLQERAKKLEDQIQIDMSSSQPVQNEKLRKTVLQTWSFMRENADYYAALNCHEHLYPEEKKGWFN